MPYRPLKPCAYLLCANLTDSRYCDKHKPQIKVVESRPGAAQRGYDSRWRRLRAMYLKQNPLCEMCRGVGAVRLATLVHHKQKVADRFDLRLYWNNLESQCIDCHAKVTAKEKRDSKRY